MSDIDITKLMSVIIRIRNCADHVTVSGHDNRDAISFIYNSCNELLSQLGAALEASQNAEKQSDQKEEEML